MARRPVRLHVNYLGFSCSLGSTRVDYAIVDPVAAVGDVGPGPDIGDPGGQRVDIAVGAVEAADLPTDEEQGDLDFFAFPVLGTEFDAEMGIDVFQLVFPGFPETQDIRLFADEVLPAVTRFIGSVQ